MEEKICSKCNKLFYQNRKVNPELCKSCFDKKRAKEYRQCNPEHVKEYRSEFYEKNKDVITKKSKEDRIKNPGRYKQTVHKYYLNHKEERKLYKKCSDKKYYQKNKERLKNQSLEYYKDHKEARAIYSKQYREDHKEEIAIAQKQWKKEHPDKVKVNHHKRRARKMNNGGTFTDKEWLNLLERYNYTCLRCFRDASEVKLTADHVIPLIEGGLNSIENIQPLCCSCNSSKGTKIIDYRCHF